ncbi:MAG: YdcF family protein [Hyphomicrobiaceae bacterium]
MASWARRLGVCTVIGGLGLLVGFAMFASTAKQKAPLGLPNADAIVVLTGGEDRIETGIRLLSQGKGHRLLISGVNPSTRAAEIGRLAGQDSRLFRCCIDFGYVAVDTSGNAAEARAWAESWGYSKLIVVTSSYHMPRSLVEFARVLPAAELLSYPVGSRHYHLDAWWQHPPTARLLAAEYAKFLTAAARLGFTRLFVGDQRNVAGSPDTPSGRI